MIQKCEYKKNIYLDIYYLKTNNILRDNYNIKKREVNNSAYLKKYFFWKLFNYKWQDDKWFSILEKIFKERIVKYIL